MTSKYAFENNFRGAWEFLVSLIALSLGGLCLMEHQALAIDVQLSPWVSLPFFMLGVVRLYQGLGIYRFKKRLLVLKSFSMSTHDVPVSKKHMYMGLGFRWLLIHRQRLMLLEKPDNQKYMQKNLLYRWVQQHSNNHPQGLCHLITTLPYLPFKPLPDIGGKPWIHGVGSGHEKPIYLSRANKNSHECVFGMTRVGKTRYMSIKVNQDIRVGEAVLVIDPKGDLEVMQDMYCAAKAANRLHDFQIIHLGFPEISAKYNPLASFSNVSEVASRITGAMSANGQGQQFKDFAWQYVNIVSRCLYELKEPIHYKTISFYIRRPEMLLIKYVDSVFPAIEPGYLADVQQVMDTHQAKLDKNGNEPEPMKRSYAIKKYLTAYIESKVSGDQSKELMDSVVVPLYNASMLDKTYYDKITASVGPVLDKINQTQAHDIFSWDHTDGLPVVDLESMIKRKKIVYIGLDSLTNKDMAEAVGQAIISDLVSLCGRLYSASTHKPIRLHLYCDEFSNIVRDEFVNLLNKAGGAGICVTALTQTVNDLGAVVGQDKAKMLLGNFGTMTMLRVSNEDTASLLTQCLENVKTRTSTPSTMSNDKSDSSSGELFTTYNTDTISESNDGLVTVNDLFSLPKGQAFVLTNGGEVYKVRLPLPKNDGLAPDTFESILSEVNVCFDIA